MDKWRTSISRREGEDFLIRGQKISELLGSRDFVDMVFLLWRGSFPQDKEKVLLNAMLVSISEHGIEAPSTFVARAVASCGSSVSAAVAAGILNIGEWHGGAIEKVALLLESTDTPEVIVRNFLDRREHLPGFGHKVYKKGDPRVAALYTLAKNSGLDGKFVQKSLAVEHELANQGGKYVPLNVDGAIGALLLEMNFDRRFGKAFFSLARVAGIASHVVEEIKNEKPYRRLAAEDVEYYENREG